MLAETTFGTQFTIHRRERSAHPLSPDFPMYEFAKGWRIGVQPYEQDLGDTGNTRQSFVILLEDTYGRRTTYRSAEGPMRYLGVGAYSEARDEFRLLTVLTEKVDGVRGSMHDDPYRRVYFPRVLTGTMQPLESTSHVENTRGNIQGALISGISGIRIEHVLTWLQKEESSIYSQKERKILAAYAILQAVHRRNELHEFGYSHNHPHIANYHMNGSGDVQLLDFTLMNAEHAVESDDVYHFFKMTSYSQYFRFIGVPLLTRRTLSTYRNRFVEKRDRFKLLEKKLYRILRRQNMTEEQVQDTLLANDLFERFLLEQTLKRTSFGMPTSQELNKAVEQLKQAIADSPTIRLQDDSAHTSE